MKTLVPALAALALAASSAAASGAQLAPPVSHAKPKPAPVPAAAAPAPAAPAATAPPIVVPVIAAGPPARASGTEQGFYAALMTAQAGQAGGDPLLDKGLATAMSRLMAAGRCGDAVDLATRSARPELAARARQICAAK
jgi:2-oxoglutarate dehydrogenase E2 component (dihydrolipoamide succinyltransferase)